MTLSDQVREHLDDTLYPAIARANVFRSEVGISRSDMFRILRSEGTSWHALLKSEIAKRIHAMREEGMTTHEIAEAIGYESATSVTRFERECMR